MYLFASFSLKSDLAEGGLTAEQLAMVKRWKHTLRDIAIFEMLHLAQVNNLLAAIGGAPHFRRPDFPLPASAYPFGLAFTLEPVSARSLRRFVCFELPETLSPEHHALYDPMRAEFLLEGGPVDAEAAEDAPEEGIEPHPIDFATIGDFYHKVETALTELPEADLFIVPDEDQAVGDEVDFGRSLITVTDRASALAGLEMVILQGEGASEDAPDSHFNRLDRIRREFESELERGGEAFVPVRPVVANPMTRRHPRAVDEHVIADPHTHRIAETFDLGYEAMLHILLRYFAHAGETSTELTTLARAALDLMTGVIHPLGEALTVSPFGGTHRPAGATAGPSFACPEDVALLPHKTAAWRVIRELLDRLVTVLDDLADAGGPTALAKARDGARKVRDSMRPSET